MGILYAMKSRRSVREYKREVVPLKKIFEILDAGRYAPSGANQQPWRYIVIDSEELKWRIRREAEKADKKFHESAPYWLQRWFKDQGITLEKLFLTEAPFLIVVAGFTKAPYWLESTWISIAYMTLAAQSEGLATLTYTPGSTSFLNDILDIPREYCPVAIIPVGYPSEAQKMRKRTRKSLKEITFYNKYGRGFIK
ncbi:MAG: nitroreductase family protein [Candidatus Bathyarchaeota archaeon]|nr:nitroreductase family protein [Candidatus Bathyarchaeota archaeon]